MELHQARYVLAVLDEGSFTAAAAREHVSQSGISAQVAKLEHELGERLLVRHPRHVSLTAAGERIVPLLRRLVDTVEEVHRTADDLAGVATGRVRLGMVHGCTIPWFLDTVGSFRASHPGVELELTEGSSDRLVDELVAGDLDVALVGHAGDLPSSLTVHPVVVERLVVVVATDHPWSSRRRLRLRDLADGVLTLEPGTGIRAALESAARRAGVGVPVTLDASSPLTVLGLAARGVGVGVVAESMAVDRGDVVAVPLEGAGESALSLATRAEGGAAAVTLWQQLVDETPPR
jgi:DNA-binding transcriptional LysR family regulator